MNTVFQFWRISACKVREGKWHTGAGGLDKQVLHRRADRRSGPITQICYCTIRSATFRVYHLLVDTDFSGSEPRIPNERYRWAAWLLKVSYVCSGVRSLHRDDLHEIGICRLLVFSVSPLHLCRVSTENFYAPWFLSPLLLQCISFHSCTCSRLRPVTFTAGAPSF